MNVLILSKTFWPDKVSASLILSELCEDLSELHNVTVVVGPSSERKKKCRLWEEESHDHKLRVVRTWGTRFHKRRLIGRLINVATYYVLGAVVALFNVARPDVIIVNNDPPMLGILGALLKFRWHSKFIYYCWDLYPDIAVAAKAISNRLIINILEVCNRKAFVDSDLIIVLSETMKRRLASKGICDEKITVLPQWVDCKSVVPLSRARRNHGVLGNIPQGKFTVMYFGNFGVTQPLHVVLEAARLCASDDDVLFVLVGDGVKRKDLERFASTMQLRNVLFFPYPDFEKRHEVLTAADLHLIPLMKGVEGLQVPYKLYGILGAGRTFVAMMESRADIAILADLYDVGFVIPPDRAENLKDIIDYVKTRPEVLEQMGRRARQLAENRFDRALVTKAFSDLIVGVWEGSTAKNTAETTRSHDRKS